MFPLAAGDLSGFVAHGQFAQLASSRSFADVGPHDRAFEAFSVAIYVGARIRNFCRMQVADMAAHCHLRNTLVDSRRLSPRLARP